MKRPAKGTARSPSYSKSVKLIRPIFEETATEAGHVVVSWSALHAVLHRILLALFPKVPSDEYPFSEIEPDKKAVWDYVWTPARLPARIWSHITNDKIQRQILLEVVRSSRCGARLAKAIEWAIDRTEDLAVHRNDVVHIPLTSTWATLDKSGKKQGWYVHADFRRSSRAVSRLITGKTLKPANHFRSIAKDLYQLAHYAETLAMICEAHAESGPPPKLPRKPLLRHARRNNRGRRNRRNPFLKRIFPR